MCYLKIFCGSFLPIFEKKKQRGWFYFYSYPISLHFLSFFISIFLLTLPFSSSSRLILGNEMEVYNTYIYIYLRSNVMNLAWSRWERDFDGYVLMFYAN